MNRCIRMLAVCGWRLMIVIPLVYGLAIPEFRAWAADNKADIWIPAGICGMNEGEVRESLKRAGHTGKIAVFATSKTIKCPSNCPDRLPGFPCTSNPGYSNKVKPDAEIALLIQGEREADDPYGVPPKVIGMSRKDAARFLTDQGFRNIAYHFLDGKCAAGIVCKLEGQKEDGRWEWGKAVRRDIHPLHLHIGTAYPRAKELQGEMISILYDTLDEALEKLDKFGVRGEIFEDPANVCLEEYRNLGEGRICNQKPAVGQGTSGMHVQYFLGKGKPAVPKQSADDSPFAEEKSKENK